MAPRQFLLTRLPFRHYRILAPSILVAQVCHAVAMAIKKKVAYQKAALQRTRAAALKANAAKKPKANRRKKAA